MTTRVVYDCMVFLQGAARETGPAAACLRLAEAGLVQLYLSPGVLAEVRDVLTRPRIRKKFPALTPESVEAFLARVSKNAVILTDVPAAVTIERDPKDEKYLNLAAAAGANYLVSRDKDLLDLGDLSPAELAPLRERCPGLRILDPVAFLREIRSQSPAPQPSEPPASGEQTPPGG
jgi:putative PIN family toxin of toxin-antitoxin system